MIADKELLQQWIVDALRRTIMHYGFWFQEVERLFGAEKTMEMEKSVWEKSTSLHIQRLSKALAIELSQAPILALKELPEEQLNTLLDALAINWLVSDGVWFQEVENNSSLSQAKRCNDNAWNRFSPFEAFRIKTLLDLPKDGGLEALKTALGYRLYARINTQEFVEEKKASFVFRMVKCRVQSARDRKGLEKYPCKSGGIIEYRSFAQTIDPRIQVECLGCPPDCTPPEWACAWRFSIDSCRGV